MKSKSKKDPRKIPDIDIMFDEKSQTYAAYHEWYLKSYPNQYVQLKNSIFYDQLIYEMFMSDFHEVILNNRMIDKEIIGEFTFTKKVILYAFD
jgi:hypothetical protein